MAHQAVEAVLDQAAFFEPLTPEDRQAMAAVATRRSYEAGTLIFAQGDPVDAFFLVISGLVQAYKIGPEGKEMVLHLVEPGEVFAEHLVFGGIAAYPAYAMCLKPTDVLAIEATAFKALVATRPEILMRMLARLSHRLQEFNRLIEDLSLHSVDTRLARYLLHAMETAPQPEAAISVQKKTLAALLGTVPETLSRALKRLKEQHVVGDTERGLVVLDAVALRAQANLD